MAIFEAKEIFKFAIRIEENGEKFYRFASNLTDNEELDSVLYYHEVVKFVSVKQKDLIEEIIVEERKHYAKLSEMKENLK
jgi:rubrerythrin